MPSLNVIHGIESMVRPLDDTERQLFYANIPAGHVALESASIPNLLGVLNGILDKDTKRQAQNPSLSAPAAFMGFVMGANALIEQRTVQEAVKAGPLDINVMRESVIVGRDLAKAHHSDDFYSLITRVIRPSISVDTSVRTAFGMTGVAVGIGITDG